MENWKFKKILVLLIILLSIILIILFYFNKKRESIPQVFQEKGEKGENVLESYGKDFNGGIDKQSYFDIKNCIQQYLNYINMNNSQNFAYDEQGNYVRFLDENEIKEKIYKLLSNKYISEKNITIENLYDNVKVLQETPLFIPIEAKLIQDGNIKSFLIYGIMETVDYKVIDKFYAVVNINIRQENFSIEPIYGNYSSIDEITIEQFEEKIESNEYNKYSTTFLENDAVPKEYINTCKRLALGAPEILYELLDESYRNAKFESLETFKKYIEKNKSKIISSRLQKYKTDNELGKTRYICVDQYENYYIINNTSIFQDYTVMLDKYTINLPEFIEKYDNSEVNVKVALNIEKLIEATKLGDYKYVYSKLNESFKTSYLKNQETFEKFINMKYDPENDVITYEKYEEITGVHVYHIKVTKQKENKEINAKVVMDLKENRDFEISFSKEV